MKTIVYQSYRTEDVPQWITTCMESVRNWTKMQGFEYRFIKGSGLLLAHLLQTLWGRATVAYFLIGDPNHN